jgi:hypothetical protein
MAAVLNASPRAGRARDRDLLALRLLRPQLHVNRLSDQLSVHVARLFGGDQAEFRLVGGDLHPICFDALHAAANLPAAETEVGRISSITPQKGDIGIKDISAIVISAFPMIPVTDD